MTEDNEWLQVAGRYRKDGQVVRGVSIGNENEREGILKFRLEPGEEADFRFLVPLPKVDVITWNGNIVCCGGVGRNSRAGLK